MRNALTGVERALFWTLAFATFAAAAAGLAARAVDRLAVSYETARSSYAIVRVIDPEGPAGLAAAEAALGRTPLIASAAAIDPQHAAALLGVWSGSEPAPEDLPPLQLIEVELSSAAASADVPGELAAVLAESGVTAEIIEAPAEAGGGGLTSRVRAAAFWGAAAFTLMMAVIISLTARSIAARRREMVTVMCDLGATRSQAAGRVADEAAVLGLYAGLAGGALAGVVGLTVLWLAVPGMTLDALAAMILPVDLAPVAAAPLLGAIAAGAGARAAAGYFHAQAARLG